MTCELVDFLVTVSSASFVDSLLNQPNFFKGISNICKKTSYQLLKQKIVDVFLSIAGKLQREGLTHTMNSGSMKWVWEIG